MKVLITGGLGYLGQCLARKLSGKAAVHIYDNGQYLRNREASYRRKKDGNVLDYQTLASRMSQYDVVVHLAAIVGEAAYAVDPTYATDVNVGGTINVLRAARTHGIPLFFASTCSVLGRQQGESTSATRAHEGHLPAYASSKRICENELLASGYDKVYIWRFASLFGASPRLRNDLVINRFCEKARGREVLDIHGGGDQIRPFLHVRDAANICAQQILGSTVQLPNIAAIGRTDQNASIQEIASLIAARADVEVRSVDISLDGDERSYFVQFDEQYLPPRKPEDTINAGIDELLTSASFWPDYAWNSNETGLRHNHAIR
ncbi:NAD-dependent epimerase/dehydratase family protein [Microbacterium sp. CFBP 8794]|uniref:NAD-dependent epimerase/dehydratase family protein n=1 Tax=Microbacterium sp. CFBP 8794 TaxID=2775269 RepID=UPI001784A4CB|nr:SDR family oxidoreductase [Microbacterium sp. CFBP 8794]MBD8478943.1 SDR family oxidoreductase [Microbacterium sp. CFBP 8794]